MDSLKVDSMWLICSPAGVSSIMKTQLVRYGTDLMTRENLIIQLLCSDMSVCIHLLAYLVTKRYIKENGHHDHLLPLRPAKDAKHSLMPCLR